MPRRTPLAVLLVLLAGCTSSSDQPVPVPTPSGTALGCAAMIAELPTTLPQGIKRRETAASSTTAAWGDPPITLRCGVPEGLEVDEPYSFNTVTWAMHDIGAARRWTTRKLRVNVEVVVPDAYDSQAELLGSLSKALLDNLR
ncbi:MAG: hypothetical protein JWN31_1966 [Frankiales bacterium]|nr:hypothetical protein [Frankiales bacterium]